MKAVRADHRAWARLRLAGAAVVVVLATGAVVALPASVAEAASDVVTNCSGSSSDPGSLPYEVSNSGSGDTITFALAPACSTIALASTIGISHDLTITGPGAAILAVSGGGSTQDFVVVGGTVSLSGLTIENGNASDGGGIENFSTLTVSNSTVSNDTAGLGGGIYNGGTLTVSDSTLSHDTASQSGGGIESNTGTMTVVNTTVSDDTATSSAGGGIDMFDGTATITNSTFSGDSAGFGGGIEDDQGDLSLGATIVAGSPSGSDCFLQLPIGTFTDLGDNLDDDGTCQLTAGSDDSHTAAGLDPSGLANNGGPTQTVALASGSAAIDHVSNGSLCPAADQRGAPRSVPCDIGAYDTDWGPAVTISVSGSETSGGGASLTYTTDAPGGVISGTLSCTTVDGGIPISPSLAVGYHTVDGASCSGLASSDQSTHAVFPSSYQGVADGFVVAASPSTPVVSKVSPSTGLTTGGTTVTLTGSGFTGATTVDFDGTQATINTVTNDTSMTVTSPPASSAGTVDVTVTAPGGTSLSTPADAFTYTVLQANPQTEPCTPSCTTNTVTTPLDNTSVSVTGDSGNSDPNAATHLPINSDTLNCGSSKAHNYDYQTAVSTVSTTNFATGQVLTVTEILGPEPSVKGVKVCYAASSTATAGSFLPKCKPSKKAPCLKSLVEQSGSVVATLLVPAGDPRFWAGDGALDVTSFSPARGGPGTTITIKGKNLAQTQAVVIGGAQATISPHSTDTKLIVTVPATAAARSGLISVTGASGEAVSAKKFTVTQS
jgi:hypothetical protein